MKKRTNSLQSLFIEGPIARLLKEEDDSLAHESGASGSSLDAQVDRYFGDYEASAQKSDTAAGFDASVQQMEALDWRDLVKGRLITEAPGDEEEEAGEEAPPAAPAADANAAKPGMDALNVEAFANDVARLIENYDSLLEVRSTLLRRAKVFLEKTYNEEVVKAFEDTMRDDHGMEAGNSSMDIKAEKFKAPAADRANGSAAPGAGGGAPM